MTPVELAHFFATLGVLSLAAIPGVYFGMKWAGRRPARADVIGILRPRASSKRYGAMGGLLFLAGLLVAIGIMHLSGFR
jgi:hypothetical protein